MLSYTLNTVSADKQRLFCFFSFFIFSGNNTVYHCDRAGKSDIMDSPLCALFNRRISQLKNCDVNVVVNAG